MIVKTDYMLPYYKFLLCFQVLWLESIIVWDNFMMRIDYYVV